MENTNVPQGEWYTNEWGSQRFHHEGWEIVIPEERPDSRRHAPYIICPFDDCQVDITDEGLMVFGEECGADYAGYSGVRFTIPWIIVAAAAKAFEIWAEQCKVPS